MFDNYYFNFDGKKVEVYQKDAVADPFTRVSSTLTSISVGFNKIPVYLSIPGQKIIKETESWKSYYYESWPSKEWTYVDTVENEPPPPPESFNVYPNTQSNKIIVSWLKPGNSQRDIAGYKLYRRSALGESWTLLKEFKEIDIDSDGLPDYKAVSSNSSNLYVDTNVSLGKKYIYAVVSLDVHGFESFLSMQIQAELNPKFAIERQERPLKFVSGSGAKLSEVNFVYKKFLSRSEQIIAKNNIKITANSKFSELAKHFIVKIKSLDTHTVKEYKIVIINEESGDNGFFEYGQSGRFTR